MNKDSRLGSDPLSWIKDSRIDEGKKSDPAEKKKKPKTPRKKKSSKEPLKAASPTPVAFETTVIIPEEQTVDDPAITDTSDPDQIQSSDWNATASNETLSESPVEESVREKKHENTIQVITFNLDREWFALDVNDVKEIVVSHKFTKIPSAPKGIEGIINLRNLIVPVINLKTHYKIKASVQSAEASVIVVQQNNHLIGLLVDKVYEVIYIDRNQINNKPGTVKEESIKGIIRISNKLHSIIDSQLMVSMYTKEIMEDKIMSEMKDLNHSQMLYGDEAAQNMKQFVSFFIDEDEFAMDIKEVQEINKLSTITHVPRSPKFVEGVINLRGQIVPVINLRERFNISKKEYDRHTRIIIVKIDNKWVGLIVDYVSEVLRIPESAIKNTPSEAVGEGVEFVRGIAEVNGRLVIILDLKKVLTQDEIKNIDKIKQALNESVSE